jgi:hypothetical protein
VKILDHAGLSALAIVCILSGCASTQKIAGQPADPKQIGDLGARDFGIKWEDRLVGGEARGVTAVTDGATTLTTRAGNRVFILHNRKVFPPSDETAFGGTDGELASTGTRLLLASGARKEEIAEVRVLQQFTRGGELVGKEVKMLPPERSHRTLVISRRVAGVEVVSSRLILNLDNAGRAAFMELAWPDISRDVLDRAVRYRELVAAKKFTAPRVEGAEMEAVQAVVLHSPAVGFYNDAMAAIRVIYRPLVKEMGRKAVRYVDERGEDVELPRDVDRPREQLLRRGERKQ